jgi:hypothetical protein
MDGATARQLKFAELERSPLGREEETRRIHDGIVLAKKEPIEHAYAEYLRRHGSAPVVIVADLLYDDFGEELAVSLHGAEFVDRTQMETYYKGGYTVIATAWSPADAHALLIQRYGEDVAGDTLRDPGPGKFWAFVASMGVLSAYRGLIPET